MTTIDIIIAICWLPFLIIVVKLCERISFKGEKSKPLYKRASALLMIFEVFFGLIAPIILMLGGIFAIYVAQFYFIGLFLLLGPIFPLVVNYKATLNFNSVTIFEDGVRINSTTVPWSAVKDIVYDKLKVTATIKFDTAIKDIPSSVVIWACDPVFTISNREKMMAAWKSQRNE